MDFDRDGIQGKAAAVHAAQGRPPARWQLLPPVMYMLRRRWYQAQRHAMLMPLTKTQRKQITSFQSTTTGRFTAAAGTTPLATAKTWKIVQRHGWPGWTIRPPVVAMLTAAVVNAAVQTIRDARTRRTGAAKPPAGEQHQQERRRPSSPGDAADHRAAGERAAGDPALLTCPRVPGQSSLPPRPADPQKAAT